MINQQPYILYTLLDASESRATQRYHIRRTATPGAALQAASSLQGVLAALSVCAVLERRFVLPAVAAATPAPAPGVRLERHGVFVFGTLIDEQWAIVAIPGILPGMIVPAGAGAGLDLDKSHPAIVAFVAEMISGRWVNKFGYTITRLEAAYIQERNAVYIPDWLV